MMEQIDTTERLLAFSVQVIELIGVLPKDPVGEHIAEQILRSGTLAGALYQEAQVADNSSSFIEHHSRCLKQLRETNYWLKLLERIQYAPAEYVQQLLAECQGLCEMIKKSMLAGSSRRTGRL